MSADSLREHATGPLATSGAGPANPFRLLDHFRRTDRLFGRDADLVLTVSRITSARTTLLFAGTGVGKTSFLQAKLIPTLEPDYVIAFFSAWSGPDPTVRLRQVILETLGITAQEGRFRGRAALREALGVARAPETHQPVDAASLLADDPVSKPLLLILDQFEELFQHGSNDPRTRKCVGQLSWFVKSFPVRLVISMREEFLGELSVFDNRLPDLLANYHKLKRLRRAEAGGIIRQTARAHGVETSPEALERLVRDLSRVNPVASEPGKSPASRATEFVAPPFLQIACYRLWEKRTDPSAPFLADYPEDGAGRELDAFCTEQLKLSGMWRRYVAPRCFEYLVTRRGAKVAYESTTLARLLVVPIGAVRKALDPLTEKRTRILRSWDVSGVRWYELYHDVYAPIVQRWSEDKRQRRRRVIAMVGAVSALVVFALALAVPALERDRADVALLRRTMVIEDYSVAREAFGRLQGSWLNVFNTTDEPELWAGYLEQRARLATRQQNRDLALLLWLEAAQTAPASDAAARRQAEATLLMDDALVRVRATYPGETPGQPYASASGARVLLKARDGQLVLWNAADGGSEPLPSALAGGDSASPSAPGPDGDNTLALSITALAFNKDLTAHVFAGVSPRRIAMLAPLDAPPSRPVAEVAPLELGRATGGDNVLTVWDSIGRPLPVTPDFVFAPESTGAQAQDPSRPAFASPPQLTQEFAFDPQATAPQAQPPRRIDFSVDGRFVAASQGGKFGVYVIEGGGARQITGDLPGEKVDNWAFGTAGSLFLVSEGRARHWRLEKDRATLVCEIPMGSGPSGVFASAARGEFVTTSRTAVSIWKAEGCTAEGPPVTPPTGFEALAVSSDTTSMQMVIQEVDGVTRVWDLLGRRAGESVVLSPPYVILPHDLLVVETAGNGARAVSLGNLPAVRDAAGSPPTLAVSSNGLYALIDPLVASPSPAAYAPPSSAAGDGRATRTLSIRSFQTGAQVAGIEWDAAISPRLFDWSLGATGRFALASNPFGSSVIVLDTTNGAPRPVAFRKYVTDAKGETLLGLRSATASDLEPLVVYDVAKGHPTELGTVRSPRDLLLSDDARYAGVVGRFNAISIWRLSDRSPITIDKELLGESSSSTSLYFGPQGRAAIVRGATIHIARINGESPPRLHVDAATLQVNKAVSTLLFLGEDSVLVALVGGGVQLWTPRNGARPPAEEFNGTINRLVLSDRGDRVAFQVDDWVHVYDVRQGTLVHNRSRLVEGSIFATGDQFFVVRTDGTRVSIDAPKVEGDMGDLSPATWARRLGQRLNQNGRLEPYSPNGSAELQGAARRQSATDSAETHR